MKKFLLAIFLIAVSLLSPQKTFAAEANYNTSPPEPVPVSSDIGIAISGKGFGTFYFSLGSSLRLQFTVGSNSCVKNSGNTAIYKDFRDCKITNKDLQTWSVIIIRAGLTQGVYPLILDCPSCAAPNRLIDASITVGAPAKASFETLNIKIYSTANPSFSGPFSDATANDLTIEWNPAVVDAKYQITTTLPPFLALPFVTCQSTVCSTHFTVPQGAATGVHTVTVKQDGEATRGSTTFEITSSTVEKPSPPPIFTPPPLPLNCLEGTDYYGRITKDKKDMYKCTKIGTALGEFDITPEGFVKKIFAVLLSLSGGVAVILIIISGYRLMNSQGNPEKVQAAREQLTSAIVGLLFIIFSLTILQIIGVDILRIPGINP